jgi:hypothetical protein
LPGNLVLVENSVDRQKGTMPQPLARASAYDVRQQFLSPYTTLDVMKPVLRLISFVVGCALTLAPMYLLVSFSYAVGEPPSSESKGFGYFALPLIGGVALGGGLLLAGLPNLVIGPMRPVFRSIAAVLLVISVVAVSFIGFDGSVTAILCPFILLLNAAAFFFFVYPAKHFSNASSRG